jgi:hypothetical protein
LIGPRKLLDDSLADATVHQLVLRIGSLRRTRPNEVYSLSD